jgi:hypothetical protein
MTDRYVIVDRAGRIGPGMDRQGSDTALCYSRLSGNPGRWPAYRIRIKKKAMRQFPSQIDHAARYRDEWPMTGVSGVPESTYRPDPYNNLPAGVFRP